MAEIEVPDSAELPMDHIAEGVRGLRIGFVNVFGVDNGDGTWALIDAGLPYSARLIRNWAEKHYGGPPQAIVLTHGHFDHVSGAKELAEEWGVAIYAHTLETPYLTGEKEYPPPRPEVGGGLMATLSPMYPRGPVDLSKWLRPLASGVDGKELIELPQWQILHTPGHTPGHISLFRTSDSALLVGDAFCTTKPESFFEAALAQSPELHGPPAYFTSDPNQAARSIRRLVKLNPHIVIPGHGRPLAGAELQQRLPQLASEMVEEAGINDQAAAA